MAEATDPQPEVTLLRDRLAMDRTVLANERTLLSYTRTALTLVIVAVSFIKLFATPFIIATGWVLMAAAAIVLGLGWWAFPPHARDDRRRETAGPREDVESAPPTIQFRHKRCWYDSRMPASRSWNLRKILPRAIAFLLIGAVVNVAVAWACAIIVDPTKVPEPVIGLVLADGESWEVARVDRLGLTWIDITRARGSQSGVLRSGPPPENLVPSWGSLREADPRFLELDVDEHGGSVVQHRSVLGCGWPVRSLWCQLSAGIGGRGGGWSEGLNGALDVGLRSWRGSDIWPRVLPLIPIWPGFAINTLFYAAILGLLWFTPGAIRRRVRRTRDRCPACGYTIASGTSDVCSECGAAVPTPRPAGLSSPPCAFWVLLKRKIT